MGKMKGAVFVFWFAARWHQVLKDTKNLILTERLNRHSPNICWGGPLCWFCCQVERDTDGRHEPEPGREDQAQSWQGESFFRGARFVVSCSDMQQSKPWEIWRYMKDYEGFGLWQIVSYLFWGVPLFWCCCQVERDADGRRDPEPGREDQAQSWQGESFLGVPDL